MSIFIFVEQSILYAIIILYPPKNVQNSDLNILQAFYLRSSNDVTNIG